jgi:hypothetical protein
MTTELTEFVITQPGLYDLTHEQYHADPIPGGSLSSTGARKLTPPDGSPARFWHDLKHPEHKRSYDFGQLAHGQLTGVGPDVEIIGHDNYKTKAAQEAKQDAYDEGKIPVLPHEWDIVKEMMQAIQAHAWARALFERGSGVPEPSMFWRDMGIWKRSRPDWISYRRHPKTHQLMIPEYKTAPSAEKHKFTRHAHDLGYHQQAAWICDAVTAVGMVPAGEDPMFLIVVQEKRPPYIVNVVSIHERSLMYGRAMNEAAVKVYKECRAANRWPGYSDEIEPMPEPPIYLEKQYEDYLDD